MREARSWLSKYTALLLESAGLVACFSLPYFSRDCLITTSGESGKCSQSPLLSTSIQNLSPFGSSLVVQWLGLRPSTAGGTGWIPSQGSKIPHDARCGKKKNMNLLPLPTSSLAAGHCILLVAFLLLLLLLILSLLKCLSNTLLPRHSFGHHVLMTFLSNYLLEEALRCL